MRAHRKNGPAREVMMKKLFGVMILAAFPVACGNAIPSGPDAAALGGGDDATVSASRSGGRRRTPTAPAIGGIRIDVVDYGKGYTTLRLTALTADDSLLPLCGAPTWSVSDSTRSVTLSSSRDAFSATLEAAEGEYEVTATLIANGQRLPSTVVVKVTEAAPRLQH